MKMSVFTLILLVTSGCSSGFFGAEESTMRKIAGTEASSTVDTSASGNSVDQAAAGTTKSEADSNGSSTPAASVDGATAGTGGTPSERAAAIAKACPQVDPKVIEQLIASGQPFEVECEVEIEVGPDNDD